MKLRQSVCLFLFLCFKSAAPAQSALSDRVPIGWSAGGALGLIVSGVGLYKLVSSQQRRKKIRAELAKKPRNVRLQMKEEDAAQGVLVGTAVLSLAGLLTAISAYKIGMAARKPPAVIPAVSAVGGGSESKGETREGYDSKGNLLPGWGLPNESAAQAPPLTPRPPGLPPYFGWDFNKGLAWYAGARGPVYSQWGLERPVAKQED
jgi:hypothetical protein